MPRPGNDRDLELIAKQAADEARAKLNMPDTILSAPSKPKEQEPQGSVIDPNDMIVRELALTALVLNAGRVRKAVQQLNTQGLQVTEADLTNWKVRHAKEYNEIAEKQKHTIEENIIYNLRETIGVAEAAERAAVEIALNELERAKQTQNLRVTDAAIAANNLANIKSKAIDRLLTFTGRPSSIVETRNAEVLLRKLQSSGVLKVKKTEDNDDRDGA